MSVKRAFFSVFQKLTLFCCAIFFGFANAFSANLPTGYTELEYIKSSDNAFLNTGYILQSDNIKYEWEAIDATTVSNSSLFGSETNTTQKYSGILYGYSSSRTLFVGSSRALDVGYATDTTSFHSWVLDITSAGQASLYKDGTRTATVNWTVPVQKSLSIYIFSNHSMAQYANNVSLKYFKITDNNELKVNLVPAQRDSDGKIGMYDLAGDRFITNTQGNLIAGPEVLPIKIATTAYNSARFSPVQTDLNSAVATIRDVVTNTINQTAAIASLQADKQTRPDAECPKFRQCLLVEDNNNIPHWYVIKDPVRDLVTSLRDNKINSAGETTTTAYAANGYDGTNGTADSRYYKGYVAMRELADGSTSVNTRQFGAALTGGDNGGQYKTLVPQEWAVTWDGNETGTANSFLPGVIYGTSRCSKVKPSSTAVGTEGWTTIENSDPVNDAENIQSYVQCYCKMTGVGVDGDITPVKNSSRAPWVFAYTATSAAYCANRCAYDCASVVRGYASFRQSLMGWAVE